NYSIAEEIKVDKVSDDIAIQPFFNFQLWALNQDFQSTEGQVNQSYILFRRGRMVVRVIGTGDTRNLAMGLKNRNFPTQRITLSPSQSDLGTQHEFDQVAAFKRVVSPERYWNGAMQRPSTGRTSTQYGVRRYYNGVFAQDYYHRGLDYAAATGSPVTPPAAGRIALTGRVSDGFELHGNTIGIDHGQGVLSIMIHLSRIDVNEGDRVQPGQVIGAIGTTGASTGPHLHWGLYVHGIAVDPAPWMARGFE
ncbi:MAG: M23 family metallopeptidase, partial [Nodosilinea sp.]